MIKVYIPNNNIKEREYIIDIMLGEFLGLNYEVTVDSDSDGWILELENGNRLIVKDCFFNKFPTDLEYLKEESIPKEVKFIQSKFASEDDVVVIYGGKGEGRRVKGEGRREKEEGSVNTYNPSTFNLQPSTLITNIDLFASAFFMLTRWEEYVIKARDNHNRFLESEALAVKFGFINRPVVNEYLQMLLNMLKHLGLNQQPKSREFKLTVTHDVDEDLLFRNLSEVIKRVGADILKKRDIALGFNTIKAYLQKKDPFDTFDFLMDASEELGIKSHFYFMAKGLTKFDNYYKSNSKFIQKTVAKIKKRGHTIGIHYSYNAYNNKQQLLKEKRELEERFEHKMVIGRNHYLRFSLPESWQIIDSVGIEDDGTLGYAFTSGFRCGVCYPYRVFDILNRKKLKLREHPLIVMETTHLIFGNSDDYLEKLRELKDRVRAYNGEFTYLWHNSTFDFLRKPELENLYKESLRV